jgi:hypothetical protein
VRKCLSRETSLTTRLVRSFARRQREYILAYHRLHQEEDRQNDENPGESKLAINPSIIEKYVKQFKTHRCIFDSDRGFIKSCTVVEEEKEAATV